MSNTHRNYELLCKLEEIGQLALLNRCLLSGAISATIKVKDKLHEFNSGPVETVEEGLEKIILMAQEKLNERKPK